MNPDVIKAFFREQIVDEKSDYLKDLAALSHEQLASRPNELARSPYDFTYEVIYVNRRLAQRLRGETPEPATDDGWMKAPIEFQDKERAMNEFETSMDEVLAAWDGYDLPLDTPIQLKSSTTNALNLGYMAAHHATYHDAQLNYLQSLNGDDQMHW